MCWASQYYKQHALDCCIRGEVCPPVGWRDSACWPAGAGFGKAEEDDRPPPSPSIPPIGPSPSPLSDRQPPSHHGERGGCACGAGARRRGPGPCAWRADTMIGASGGQSGRNCQHRLAAHLPYPMRRATPAEPLRAARFLWVPGAGVQLRIAALGVPQPPRRLALDRGAPEEG